MIRVEALPAGRGDCLWIEYGPANGPVSRVLVDGGTGPTGRVLIDRLTRLPEAERRFELVVVTHVDEDHIGGVLELLRMSRSSVDEIWFNGWKHLKDLVRLLRPQHGVNLTELIGEKPVVPWNTAFNGGRVAVVDEQGALPFARLPGGMTLTVVSPDLSQLTRLAQLWHREVGAVLRALDAPSAPGGTLLGRRRATPPLNPRMVRELAAAPFVEDASVTNGSSIALLAEYEGRRVLLTGDAYPTVMTRALTRHPLAAHGPIPVDLMKLSHHGSRGNINRQLLAALDCREFLVCTNGAGHAHPCRESIARVLVAKGTGVRLHFNYASVTTTVWRDASLQRHFKYDALFPQEAEDGIVVEVGPATTKA